MKKIILLPFFIFSIVQAQLPETDIFLCSIKKNKTEYNFSKPENITNRKGYDNQPCFTPNGKKILFVAIEDSTQSDIYSYDIKSKKVEQFTHTKESEYSPAYTPDRKSISVVRVDADSGQRFYRLSLSDVKTFAVVNNSDSIGYSCWLNDSMVAMFILGPANTLQLLNTKNSERKLIASDIGRCMRLSPDGKKMYFVLKGNETEWFIYSMSVKDFSLTRVTATLPGNEDYAIMPDGSLIMGSEGKLYHFENSSWKMIADFSKDLTGFYRLAINSDGTLLALVAFTGKKP